MNLVKSRLEFRNKFETGDKPSYSDLYKDYKEFRLTEDWRVSRTIEELLEYICFLEEKVNEPQSRIHPSNP